jgi:hypothetical protein
MKTMKVRAVETGRAQLCLPIRVPGDKDELKFLTPSSWLSLILFVFIRGFMSLSVSSVSSADVALLALACVSNKGAKSALW